MFRKIILALKISGVIYYIKVIKFKDKLKEGWRIWCKF